MTVLSPIYPSEELYPVGVDLESIEDCDDFSGIGVVRFFDAGHDGDGWYYYDDDLPEEGCVGAFGTKEEAVAEALESYSVVRALTFAPAGTPSLSDGFVEGDFGEGAPL